MLCFRVMTGSYSTAETVVNRMGLCHKKPTDQNDFYTERKEKKQAFQRCLTHACAQPHCSKFQVQNFYRTTEQVPQLPLRALRLHQRPHLQRPHQAHPDSASIPQAQAQHNFRSGDAYDRHRSRRRLGRTRTPRLLVCLLRVF